MAASSPRHWTPELLCRKRPNFTEIHTHTLAQIFFCESLRNFSHCRKYKRIHFPRDRSLLWIAIFTFLSAVVSFSILLLILMRTISHVLHLGLETTVCGYFLSSRSISTRKQEIAVLADHRYRSESLYHLYGLRCCVEIWRKKMWSSFHFSIFSGDRFLDRAWAILSFAIAHDPSKCALNS